MDELRAQFMEQLQLSMEEAERETVRRLEEQANGFRELMENQNRNYGQRIAELNERVVQAEHVANAVRAEAAEPRPQRVKLSRPETFDGNLDGLEVDEWLFKCTEYFETMGTTAETKVGFAASLLNKLSGKIRHRLFLDPNMSFSHTLKTPIGRFRTLKKLQ